MPNMYVLIPCTITVIIAVTFWLTFAVKFLATQVYTVVCGVLVETSKTCTSGSAWGLTGLSFWYHCTVGVDSPIALHHNETLSPTLTVCGDCGVIWMSNIYKKTQ